VLAIVMAFVTVAGTGALVSLRTRIELGLGPSTALQIAGVPFEYVWLVWFVAAGALQWDRALTARRGGGGRGVQIEWVVSVVGVAGVMWSLHGVASARLLATLPTEYWLCWAAVFAMFILASSALAAPVRQGWKSVPADALRLCGRPATWLCSVAVCGLLAFAPRSTPVPAGGRAFARWYSRQPRATMPTGWQIKPVTLVEFVDYQCPVCRRSATMYESTIRDLQRTDERTFGVRMVDFPLESECNPARAGADARKTGGLHQSACEAAAAVRLAKAQSSQYQQEVIDWLWAHQEQLTPKTIFPDLKAAFGLDVGTRYEEMLPAIEQEAAVGRRLGVSGTPTLFLNGRKLPLVSAAALRAAIDIEIDAAKGGAKGGVS
jgi:protein-disulfide isomerase